MFDRVLVANRGEIAIRVIRACRDLGVGSVAVYSDADRASDAVRLADHAVSLGEPTASASYLNIDKIIDATKSSDCQAIHPGYGFLSENPALAARCEEEGIAFIGPSSATLRLAGDKVAARASMREAKVPVIPGTDAPVADVAELRKVVKGIGFPLMLKAAGGGGGKGIRTVQGPDELESSFRLASSEAQKAFGDGRLYVEKQITGARHVEVQILADGGGQVIHLGERECSLQRRHQKLIEETPCPALTDEARKEIWKAAVRGAKAIGYRNAGTIEFLVDPDGSFHFLEVNARLQVEHPVTEMVTGIDLVRRQIRIAAGEPLDIAQKDVRRRGAAIEGRIYAEDPDRGFAPSPGKIQTCALPGGPGVRVDGGIRSGLDVSLHYDPLLAKVIAWGEDRDEAIRRLDGALSEMVISGVRTTGPIIGEVLREDWYREGSFDTTSLERYLKGRKPEKADGLAAAVAAALVHHQDGGDGRARRPEGPRQSPWVFWGRVRQVRRDPRMNR
jgi:acetyl-CoA carboxylase biotin carboxylase subunit